MTPKKNLQKDTRWNLGHLFLKFHLVSGDGIKPMTQNKNLQSGFIALVSVILISFVLITFVVSIGLSGFLGRSNQLESEFKEQSIASAEACVEKATADLVAGNPTTGTVTFGGGKFTCTIDIVPNTFPGQTTIKTQGVYKNSYTNLVVVVDSATQAVISWREFATMP